MCLQTMSGDWIEQEDALHLSFAISFISCIHLYQLKIVIRFLSSIPSAVTAAINDA